MVCGRALEDDVISTSGVCVCCAAEHWKMTWLVDFEGYTLAKAPPIKVSLQTLHIMQVRARAAARPRRTPQPPAAPTSARQGEA